MRLGKIAFDYTEAGFLAIKQAGLSFAEICLNSGEDAAKVMETAKAIRAASDAAETPIACVGRWNHTVQKNGRIDPDELAQYLALVDLAEVLGARTLVVGCNYDAGVSLYKNYTNAISLFGSMLERAEGRGLRIAVENCNWNNFVVSPREWEVVLGELPALCLKYDASHAYNRGGDYLAELSDYGDRIAHVHIKGVTRAGAKHVDDPPAGMDDLKWGAIFSILYARGYDGDLSIEPHSKTWRGERGAAGVAFTKRFIEQYMI